MFHKIKKGLKRAIVFILILGGVVIVVITTTNLFGDRLFVHKTTKVWIDSDSGNEIDDLFAISRAIIAPEIELVGLSSAQWEFHPDANGKSLEKSQVLNQKLLQLFNKNEIPHPSGAKDMLRFWAEPKPADSPAAQQIIATALALSKNEKLNVVCLGALTNIASAVLMNPEIIPKIRIYAMTMLYNPKTRVWNKNEFNARNDLDALDIILNTEDLELNIMTATTSRNLIFTKKESLKYMKDKGEPWDFLVDKWEEKFPENDTKIMRGVAIIEAIIDPELSRFDQVLTPPENKQRTITVYTGLNKELMIAEYWAAVLKYFRKNEKAGKTNTLF